MPEEVRGHLWEGGIEALERRGGEQAFKSIINPHDKTINVHEVKTEIRRSRRIDYFHSNLH